MAGTLPVLTSFDSAVRIIRLATIFRSSRPEKAASCAVHVAHGACENRIHTGQLTIACLVVSTYVRVERGAPMPCASDGTLEPRGRVLLSTCIHSVSLCVMQPSSACGTCSVPAYTVSHYQLTALNQLRHSAFGCDLGAGQKPRNTYDVDVRYAPWYAPNRPRQ